MPKLPLTVRELKHILAAAPQEYAVTVEEIPFPLRDNYSCNYRQFFIVEDSKNCTLRIFSQSQLPTLLTLL